MRIGAPVRRREDRRFLTGSGRYVDDLAPADCLHMAVARSVHASAIIERIDVTEASAMHGVVTILTGAHWRAEGLGDLPCASTVPWHDGRPMNTALRPVLAGDRVRHAGEPLAIVIADTRERALDAAEALDVRYTPLAPVTDPVRAAADTAPLVHEHFGTNVAFDTAYGDPDCTAAALAKAPHVVELTLVNNRQVVNPMEPRSSLAVFETHTQGCTLYTTSQAPHLLRSWLCGHTFHLPERFLRVVAPDVGGGFGMKLSLYPEDALVLWAARHVRRPVKWTATRTESFLSDTHARGHVAHARMGLGASGQVLAVEVDNIGDLGAYASLFGAGAVGVAYARMMPGPYRFPYIHVRVRGVYTNTVPVDVYRGAGRPEAAYVVERLFDVAARKLGIDPLEIRRRNVIRADEYPYETPTGMVYDSGNYPRLLDRLSMIADYEKLRAAQQQARGQGRLVGIGVSSFIDYGGGPRSRTSVAIGREIGSFEYGAVQVNPGGSVTVMAGTHNHGQGHETSYAQIVADGLGCAFDAIEVVCGDTDRVPVGLGTWGSRSVVMAGNALAAASTRIAIKLRAIAAHLLDCAPEDIVQEGELFTHAGSNRRLSFAELAHEAYHGGEYPEGMTRGLLETEIFEPDNWVFTGGAHIAVVEVDCETGVTRVTAFYSVDDCGRIVNPMIVEGQVHGGIAQGIGQAMMERCVYDDASGQLLTGSFMDYPMPRAGDLPRFVTDTIETPAPGNALGIKGAGESGNIGAPPAVVNAVLDALGSLEVAQLDMPLTPESVWKAIRRASREATA